MTPPRQPSTASAGAVIAFRALGLGDFLTAVPAYRALRRGFPDDELVLAAPPELAPLVRLTGVIDRLIEVRGLAPVTWPHASPPRTAVNLHGRGPQSHRLLRELRPRSLVAFACPDAGVPGGPEWWDDEHEVRRWCRLLGEHRIAAYPDELDIASPDVPAPVPGAVVVHPGASSGSRRWPAERFAAVAGALRDEGRRVVVTGSVAERPLAQEVADGAGLSPRDTLAGRTDLETMAAQVAQASLVVSGDTGVAHLATAYRRPSVVLFGPVPPRLWGPPRRAQHVPLWRRRDRSREQGHDQDHDPDHDQSQYTSHHQGDDRGDPHGATTDPALLRVSVSEVLGAAYRALSAQLAR